MGAPALDEDDEVDASRRPASADGAVDAAMRRDGGTRDSGLVDAELPEDAAADGGGRKVKTLRPGAPTLCARERNDAVRDLFCGEQPPSIGSLADLQSALQLNQAIGVGAAFGAPADPAQFSLVDSLVALGHSTALAGHLVSPINPRALILTRDVFMAYQRGVQKVEVISFDRDLNTLNFYLIEYEQACNREPDGCRPGDLYTPRVERDWLNVTIRDDEDLKNTSQDCRQCHQRGLEYPTLLIRELNGTWPHFFAPDPVGAAPNVGPDDDGRDLVQDFLRAKGDEPYGNIPVDMFRQTSGLMLQQIAGDAQPLVFRADIIEEERWPSGPDGYAPTPVRSPTWDRAYEAFKRGEQLALPHYSIRPTDPAKQARLTEAYRRFRAGELPAEELPDLADIFPDDPKLRAEIGLTTEPGASGPELLIQACGPCHNDVLDQTISRARFNIALSRMDRAALERAIDRISLAPSAQGVMPPPDARQLDGEARNRLLSYLRAEQRPAEDDALLERAAELGMAGGGRI